MGDNTPYWLNKDSQYEALKFHWWRAPTKDEQMGMSDEDVGVIRANDLINHSRNLETIQHEVHDQNLWNAQLYSNRELAAFDWGQGALYRASLSPVSRNMENLILQGVDTMVAEVGKNRPKPTPVTRGASWKLRNAAKKLDHFLIGMYKVHRLYELGKAVFRDACIFGLGAIHITTKMVGESNGAEGGTQSGDSHQMHVERVFPDELLVDQAEVVATGGIRHLYRRRAQPIEIVAAKYNLPVETLRATAEGFDYLDYRPTGDGYIIVVEGWQLPCGRAPGRYFAAARGVELEDKAWNQNYFPFCFYRFQDPLAGFYSSSMVEQGIPYQIRMNEVNEIVRDGQDIMCRPRLLVAEGSRVSVNDLDNTPGKLVKYTGIEPKAVVWPAANPEIYNERERVKREYFAAMGLSRTSSTAELPGAARLDSSRALQEYNSIQDNRLADPAQRFEQWYLDVAHLMLRVLRDSGINPTVTWCSGGRKSRMEVLNWKEVSLDDNEYVLQLEASSIFTLTPAAQRDELERQLANGELQPEEYRRLVAHPDLESEMSIQAAAAEDIDRVIELLEDGKYETPTPIQDLVNGVIRVSLGALQLSRYEDVPSNIPINFANWLAVARGWLEKGATEGQTPPAPQPMPNIAPIQPGQGAI